MVHRHGFCKCTLKNILFFVLIRKDQGKAAFVWNRQKYLQFSPRIILPLPLLCHDIFKRNLNHLDMSQIITLLDWCHYIDEKLVANTLEALLRHILKNSCFCQAFSGLVVRGICNIPWRVKDKITNSYSREETTTHGRTLGDLARKHCAHRNTFAALKSNDMEGFQLWIKSQSRKGFWSCCGLWY